MKKLFIAAIALASVVACSKDEVVNQQQSAAISFEQAFVENATRAAEDPSTTTDSFNPLTGFDVWAFIDQPSGVVFDGEDVTGSKKAGWKYENIQYWTPDHKYYFSALAPMNSDNWSLQTGNGISSVDGAGILDFKNVDGSEDLLYAHAVVDTHGTKVNQVMDPVKFSFDHLLSKVKFTFKNGMSNNNARILVSNVTMTSPAAGSIDLATAGSNWRTNDDVLTLKFGNVAKLGRGVSEEADKERLVIPNSTDFTFTIDFDVELYYGDVCAYAVHKTEKVEGFALQMGKSYNFSAEINADNLELTPIEFTVENVNGWDETPSKDFVIDFINNTATVNNANGLLAVANGINNGSIDNDVTIELNGNVDLNDLKNRAITINWTPMGTEEIPFVGVIDGQGHKISNMQLTAAYAAFVAYAGEGAVIKNLNFENVNIESTKYAAAVVCEANNVTIENVTVSGSIKAASYAAGIVFEGSGVHILNCENNATVSSGRAGGIAAWVTDNSVIENVTNNGDITGEVSAAGITNRIGGTIKNAYNYGAIEGNGTEASAGIAGTQLTATTYEYCYNYASVTTTKDNANSSAAGILGQTPSKAANINYCANFGNITAEQSYAAGIAYSLYGNVTASYCYNEGAINGADGAGAIAPKAQYGAKDTAKYCLNAGAVTSTNGKVYQGSNQNISSYYYNDNKLYSVSDNTSVNWYDAIGVLNGGKDAKFFNVTNSGKIVVNK